jgi:hypothetical protein
MTRPWPEDTAEIYREIEEEERRLANAVWPIVLVTWPNGQPGLLEKRNDGSSSKAEEEGRP